MSATYEYREAGVHMHDDDTFFYVGFGFGF